MCSVPAKPGSVPSVTAVVTASQVIVWLSLGEILAYLIQLPNWPFPSPFSEKFTLYILARSNFFIAFLRNTKFLSQAIKLSAKTLTLMPPIKWPQTPQLHLSANLLCTTHLTGLLLSLCCGLYVHYIFFSHPFTFLWNTF